MSTLSLAGGRLLVKQHCSATAGFWEGPALLLSAGVGWWGSSPAGLGWLNSAQVSPAAEQSHAQVSAEERWQIAV